MRTVRGGGSWDLKAKEQEEGMKGINKFLEDATDFNGIAVRTFQVIMQLPVLTVTSRVYTFSPSNLLHMSCC